MNNVLNNVLNIFFREIDRLLFKQFDNIVEV